MTVSVLAFDPETGAFGAAVASRSLAVGAWVPHLRAGAGGVVVQASAPLEWGPRAVDRLVQGASAAEVSRELGQQPGAAAAQVALVDADGGLAGFTGTACEPEVGIVFGATCCCAANLMEKASVPEAVVAAFESVGDESFAERLLRALAAGDSLGGDIRGRQSAALMVVAHPMTGGVQNVDLRIDDNRSPVPELRRLLTLHRADALVASSVDDHGHYRHVEPLRTAVRLAPDDLGCISALSLALLRAGRLDEATPYLVRLCQLESRTPARLQRLIDTGHLDQDVGNSALQRLSRR